MKLFKSLFATVAALMIATSAHAAGTATVQAYAHPTILILIPLKSREYL